MTTFGALFTRNSTKHAKSKSKFTKENKVFMNSLDEKRRESMHDIYDHKDCLQDHERRKIIKFNYLMIFFYVSLLLCSLFCGYYIWYAALNKLCCEDVIIQVSIFVILYS